MNKDFLREKLVAIANSQVGLHEIGGNNLGPDVVKFQKATWLEPGPWPWCAAFTCWVLQKWLDLPEAKDLLSLLNEHQVQNFRCRDASAAGWERWAAKYPGILVLSNINFANPGDFVTFDFRKDGSPDHIGIVDFDDGSGMIHTIEGNTNGKGTRDSITGDGVWKKMRSKSLVSCFIRLIT